MNVVDSSGWLKYFAEQPEIELDAQVRDEGVAAADPQVRYNRVLAY